MTPSQKKKKQSPLYKPISILTILMICSMTTGPIWGMFTQIHILLSDTRDAACTRIGIKIYACMYFIAKGFMYEIFILRLHQVYSTSAFGYKPLTIKILCGIICCTTLLICIIAIGFNEPVYYTFNLFGKTHTHCNSDSPPFFAIIYGPHELIVTILTLVMFMKPMRKLLKTVQQHGGRGAEKRTFGFKYAAIKV